MGYVNNEKLQSLFESIKDYCQKLESFKDITAKEFLKDWELQWKIERGLERAIQAIIEISMRVIAIDNLRKPDENAGLADVLFEANIIPMEYVKKMKEMIRFRNIIVYEYFRIDSNKVFLHLKEDIQHLRQFIKYIITHYK